MVLRTFPVRPDDRARIEGILAGTTAPVTPRDAATVAIIRDSAGPEPGIEVYLMRRVRQMAFAAGMHVFPGGSVEESDRQDPDRPDGDGLPADQALRNAAVRETFEECDVTLIGADLRALAHWITPEVEPRRYDTRFFLAALPDGEECREVGTEADARLWIRPQQALDDGLIMMPPTAAVLADLARFDTVASALSAPREITVVMPRFELDGDELHLVIA